MLSNKKIFAAGNPEDNGDINSRNSIVDESNISISTVASLSIEFGFEILPDCPAAIAAGYSVTDRNNAVVWYGPTMDSNNFYYCAYAGNLNFNTFKSSILIARRRSNGSLLYAVNCDDYTLDTAATLHGPRRTVCRMGAAIDNRTLYLCTASVTNIGPQLFAVNKDDGTLKWALGFYPPEEYVRDTHKKVVRKRDDYSKYIGSNARLSDLNPVIKNNIVIVGVSSNQNLINTGLNPASPYFQGYPVYTDQGYIFGIDCDGYVVWKQSTCAPLLKKGDVIKNTGKRCNPFPPGKNSMIIGTTTKTKIVNPNNAGKFAQSVYITPTTTVNSSLVANFWATFDQEIQLVGETSLFNLTGILAKWTTRQLLGIPFQSTIYISGKTNLANVSVQGQHTVYYVKNMFPGDILNEQDAHGLNYWGNSVWGAPPTVIKRNLYYGSGQSHRIPLEEQIYYADPTRDYYSLKVPVVDAITTYIADQTPANLNLLNQAKDNFLQTIKNLSVAPERSPRGLESYPDAVLGLKVLTGKHVFGIRTIPSDTFNYIITDGTDPVQLLYPHLNSPDGDVCTGIFHAKVNNRKYLAATTKTAICALIDITDPTNVVYIKAQYLGPDTSLGGTNYQSCFDGDKIYTCCSNASHIIGSGSRGSSGQFEQFVNRAGDLILPTDSFITAIKVDSAFEVKWSSKQDFASQGSMSHYNGCVFSADGNGTLYARNAVDGSILWKFNTKSTPFPTGGSPTSACSANGQMIWINNYPMPALSVAQGSNGISLRINQ